MTKGVRPQRSISAAAQLPSRSLGALGEPKSWVHRLRHPWIGAALILIATFVAYAPVWQCGYIWDDDDYVTKNAHLRSLDGLWRLWVPMTTRQYYPVVFSTFWMEYQLWGLRPLGFHLVNVMLHALNGILVWRIARRLRIPAPWMIGAVFALHPVHVESVAWITERKNVLSGLFYLTSMIAYLRFDQWRDSPNADHDTDGHRAWRMYALSIFLFILALLSKSVTCSLPAALILVMLWQRKRLTFARVVPLVPLFIMGFALAMHTAYLERVSVGAQGKDFMFSFADRLIIACNALLFYPQKIVISWPLIFIYPRWTIDSSNVQSYWPVAVVGIVAVFSLIAYRRGIRGPALALAYFAGTIFPALGFFNVYPMVYSFVADHFQYLASLGIISLVVAAISLTPTSRGVLTILSAAVLACFGTLTWQRCWAYQDEETLWRVTRHQNPSAFIASINLGKILNDRGDSAQAISLFEEVLRQHPRMRQARNHLAWAKLRAGRHREALLDYQQLQREYGEYDTFIAQIYQAMADNENAERHYRMALAKPQAAPGAMVLLAHMLINQNRTAEAIDLLRRYLEHAPQDVIARLVLADGYALTNDFKSATTQGQLAVREAQESYSNAFEREARLRLEYYQSNQLPPELRNIPR
jgi:protein O-mannosyl-transferase